MYVYIYIYIYIYGTLSGLVTSPVPKAPGLGQFNFLQGTLAGITPVWSLLEGLGFQVWGLGSRVEG